MTKAERHVRMAVTAFEAIGTCQDLDAAKQIATATLEAFREKKLPSKIVVTPSADEEETLP